jgi:hypothetical protein
MEELGLLKRTELERVDVAKAIKAFEGNQYLMILCAAQLAREITKRRDFLDRKAEKLHYYGYKPVNQALKDIIDDAA